MVTFGSFEKANEECSSIARWWTPLFPLLIKRGGKRRFTVRLQGTLSEPEGGPLASLG
jgi:hypothetical protein